MKTTIQTALKHADHLCQSQGIRLTEKRKNVLSLLINADKALSAYELIDLHHQILDKKIQAMSMYRILEFLEQAKLIHKLNLANRYVACIHITCDHKHAMSQFLICQQCYRVTEINISATMLLEIEKSMQQVGFHLNHPQLEINGICQHCQQSS